jgi:hypothetical protein
MAGIIDAPRPRPPHEEPGEQQRVRAVPADEGVRDGPDRQHQQPDGHDAAAAVAVGQPAAGVHADRRADALRHHQQPGLQRRVAADDLVVQRQQDHRPEQRRPQQEHRRRRCAEPVLAEEPDLDQRVLDPPRVDDEGRDRAEPQHDRQPGARRRQCPVRPDLAEPEHHRGDTGRQQ